MKPTLIILAAGVGSRYGGLKQIDPVGPSGEIIIEYSVYDAARAGFGRVIFVINEQIDKQFRERVGDRVSAVVPVDYAYQRLDDVPPGFAHLAERVKPWGTAHAVYCCRNLVRGPFAAINSDDFYGASAFQKISGFISGMGGGAETGAETGAVAGAETGAGSRAGSGAGEKYACCMAGYRVENSLTEHGHVSRGVCSVSGEGYLIGVTERTRIERRGGDIVYIEGDQAPVAIEPGTIVSMNIWGFPGQVMAEIEEQFQRFLSRKDVDLSKAEFYLPMTVNEMLVEQRASVKVLKTEDKWYGVTYREDKEQVQRSIAELVKAGKYPERLWL